MTDYLKHSAAVNGAKHVRMQGAGFDRWRMYLGPLDVTTLQGLSRADAAGFIVWRKDGCAVKPPLALRPVGAAAVNRDLAAAMALWTWARETERIPEDCEPFKKVHLLSEHHQIRPHRVVSDDDVRAARAVLSAKWADCVTVLYGTAFRYGSFAGMSLASIGAGILRDPEPKGKVAVEVPASDEVRAAALRCAARRYPDDEAQQLGRRLRSACERAGVARFTAHDLRVSAATWMHRAGVSLADLQKILGHADIQTTQRYVRASGVLAYGPI